MSASPPAARPAVSYHREETITLSTAAARGRILETAS
jgi:hypothetical protein